MIFSSLPFLCVFLPAVFGLSWILPTVRLKNGLLLAASLLFYAYGEPVGVLLLICSAIINFCFGCILEKRSSKGVAGTAIAANLAVLTVFKYTGFLIGLLNELTMWNIPIPEIHLPIGISFFTFQAMSYVIDVYRKKVKAQHNCFRLLLYISLFPQLVAGPIVKYSEIEAELEARHMTLDGAARGVRRFIAGLSKKVLLANVLSVAADAMFEANAAEIGIAGAWLGAVSYMLQIYFDFSGYSDMAIGMGWMFGFHFRENFCYPLCASNVREFWRRWHISLTDWFRDYLYIPLGGSRHGTMKTAGNRFFVFLCTGIWHGANVTFLMWGAFHGLITAAESLISSMRTKRKKPKGNVVRIMSHLYTLLIVCIGFVIFRASTLHQGLLMIREMFIGFHFERAALSRVLLQLHPLYITALIFSIPAAMPVKKYLETYRWYEPFSYVLSAAGLILCILQLAGGTYNPFIYFQF